MIFDFGHRQKMKEDMSLSNLGTVALHAARVSTYVFCFQHSYLHFNARLSVVSHLERNNILTDFQHGFRKCRSCETQLILTIDDLARGLNDKQQIDAVLLDFSKAFDRVPHQRLLLNLKHYGVRGNILSWIEYFLSCTPDRDI